MREYQKQTNGLRPGIDDSKCSWTRFPNGYEYLLPVIARYQVLIPSFRDDGSVEIAVEHPDSALQPLVDRFIELVATVEGGVITIAAPNVYADFVSMVRHLLITNYEMADAEIVNLLTLHNDQVIELFNTILGHIVKQ